MEAAFAFYLDHWFALTLGGFGVMLGALGWLATMPERTLYLEDGQ